MEWQAPAILLAARPFGENDVIATVMTEAQGAHRGLVHGGQGRARAGLWQPGNLVDVRWVGRLSEQLGHFEGEMIHPAAALAMDDALQLALLTAACSVAEGALPEREAHPGPFHLLLGLIGRLSLGAPMLAELVRFEAALLADLGYGLDLSACAATGTTGGLAYVSPRTGRALSAEGAGEWAARLLRLPAFLVDAAAEAGPEDWRDGLALTGHFLARDVFGLRHLPLPPARLALYDRVAGMTRTESDG